MDLIILPSDGGKTKTLVKLEGRLDTTNSEEFEKKMAPLMVGGNPDIEIDCTDFEYISSSGLRLILTLLKSVNARGGKMVIKNLQPPIKEVFDMTGFSKIMTII